MHAKFHALCIFLEHTLSRGGGGREARAGMLAPATKYAPAYMSLNFHFTLVPDIA